MRPLSELLERNEPALPILETFVRECRLGVEMFPCTEEAGSESLLALQVTTRSFLGAVAFHTGGILVDDGWLRILGAGCPRLPRSIQEWNGLGGERRHRGGILVADDAIGGFFSWEESTRTIAYFAPDSLRWEDTELGYQPWLEAVLGEHGLDRYYEGLRWDGWRSEVRALSGDSAIGFFPFLSTREGRNPGKCSRRAVPIEELWSLRPA